jgi:8-oxo-dGTP pyrophosphatase MutT (NUDIX family)
MSVELFSIVDARDEHLRVVLGKQALHRNGGYHRSVHVFVEVFGGLFILQKKAAGTENGGKWSSSASGHVRHGESYREAAVRELEEEIGLEIDGEELCEIVKVSPCVANGNEFSTLFTYLMDPKEEELELDPSEVDEIVISALIDVIEDVEKYRDEYSPAFVELFNIFLALEKGIEGAN